MGLELDLGILGKKAKRSETGETGTGGWWKILRSLEAPEKDVGPYAWADRCWLGGPC